MAIEFKPLDCPKCGGKIEQKDKAVYFCPFCGTNLMEVNDNEHIERTIDEARIKEATVHEALELKRLEIEAAEKRHKKQLTLIGILAAIAVVLILVLVIIAPIAKQHPAFILLLAFMGFGIALTFIDRRNNKS